MLDLFFDTAFSFQALLLLCGAVFCFGIGGLMMGDFIYWRGSARRVKGKIVTYREKVSQNKMFYHAVAEYRDEKGEVCRVTSDIGSSNLDEGQIGKDVKVLYFPGTDKGARILGHGIIFGIFGFVLLGAGAFLAYQATFMVKGGWPLLLAAVGVGTMLWVKFKDSSVKGMRWDDVRKMPPSKIMKKTFSKDEGREMSLEEIRERNTVLKAQQAKWSWLILVMGLVFFGVGYYLGHSVWYLETYGISASGKVIRMEASTDSEGSTTYAPVVEYKTAQGHEVEFKSQFSSNPPSYSTGDEVMILYAQEDPENNVMIDAGWWNWLFPGIFGGIGFLMCMIIFPKMRGSADKAL